MEEREVLKMGRTLNNALSNASVGEGHGAKNLEYWSRCGVNQDREQSEVNSDMEKIFSEDPSIAIKVLFGLRLITRKNECSDEVQTGFGRKDEFFKAFAWLAKNHPQLAYDNLHLVPVFGCWKDFLCEPLIDTLDRLKVYTCFYEAIKKGDQLALKYLPQIRSTKHTRSDNDRKRVAWAKGFCAMMGLDHKQYRKMKSGGIAHLWQKQMMAKEWGAIDFNKIPGRAINQHTTRVGRDKKTVFERHEQTERLIDWVNSKPSINFTGYPYELMKKAQENKGMVGKLILDKQFNRMLEGMNGHSLGNTLVAVDTSGSMSWGNTNGVTALDVCLSLGLSFSAMNEGEFKNCVISFSSHCELVKLDGKTFCDRVQQLSGIGAMGSTNFQGIIDLLVRLRKTKPEIPLKDYPETILVVSDMGFNPVSTKGSKGTEKTNYEEAMSKLKAVGLNEVRIIWWYVNDRAKDFPSQMGDKGVYFVSGFDPVMIKALLGKNKVEKEVVVTEKEPVSVEKIETEKKEENPLQGMVNFLSQKIFDLVKT